MLLFGDNPSHLPRVGRAKQIVLAIDPAIDRAGGYTRAFGDLGQREGVGATFDEQLDGCVDRPLERDPASLLLGGTGIGLLGPEQIVDTSAPAA